MPLATATFKRSLAHKHSRASGLGKPLASPRATGDTQHEAAAAPGGCMPGLMAGARRALCACGSDSQSADAGAATAADECCSCGGKASPPGDVPCHHLSLHARRTSGRKKVAYIDELGETPFRCAGVCACVLQQCQCRHTPCSVHACMVGVLALQLLCLEHGPDPCAACAGCCAQSMLASTLGRRLA